jgi:hypothetical protein
MLRCMPSCIRSRITLFTAGIIIGITITSIAKNATNSTTGQNLSAPMTSVKKWDTRDVVHKGGANLGRFGNGSHSQNSTTGQNLSAPMTSVKKWDTRDVVHKGGANLGRFGNGSHSQVGQDETVMRILDNKRDGYFVDCAANDAVKLSNTLALETRLGWTGLCIEPNPHYHNGFRDRRCTLVAAVAGGKDGDVVEFQFKGGALGGIIGHDNSDRQGTSTFHTVSLETIFDTLNVPSVVDYFSLDVEGAELYVMEKFPFHRYKFQVITVERPRRLRVLLEQHHYVYVMDHGSFGDELYIHKSIPNFEQIMREFGIKPKPLSESLRGRKKKKKNLNSP